MPFDAIAAYEHAEKLSFPRATGSQGEKRAAEYISDFFKQLGLEVEIQNFAFSYLPSRLFLRLMMLFQLGILLAAAEMVDKSPILAVLSILLLIVLLIKASRWGRVQEHLYNIKKSGFSQNIIAKSEAKDAKITLIFLAHYDTKSQTIPVLLRFLLYCLGFFSTLLFGAIIVILAIAELNGMKNVEWILIIRQFLLPLGITIALISLLLQFNFSGNKSPGAQDNASGVGVLLELARSLGEYTPEEANLVFVATGAEEDGLVGAMRYIQKYGEDFEPQRSFFVNYDGVGAEGEISIITKYGLPPTVASKKLSEFVMNIALQKGIEASKGYVPIGAGFDQFPLAARGFEAITISNGKLDRALLAVHSSNDQVGNICTEALRNAGSLGYELAHRIRILI